MPRPYVVKPINEGSSVGVAIMRNGDNRRAEVARSWRFGTTALVEEYMPGRELTVARDGRPRARRHRDHRRRRRFYDYESKYAEGGSRHIIPAVVHPDAYSRALDVALAAHRALGCRGATRADFRYDDTSGEPGRLVLLEVNTQPGLTPTSLLPEQAAHHRHEFPAALRLDGGERDMPRVARTPRNSVNDRPSRLKLLLRRQKRLLRPRRLGVGFVCVIGLLGVLAVHSAAPGGAACAMRERLLSATGFAGLRVAEIVHRGPRQHAGAAAACGPRRRRGRLRSWASRSTRRERASKRCPGCDHATVERRLPGTIVVQLQERRPFAIWQNEGKFVLIDRAGQVVSERGRRRLSGQLPLVVGPGAPDGGGRADRRAERAARHRSLAWSPPCASASGAGTCR